MLKSAQEGAKSVGAQTEYVDLYDLCFTGCRSCLACKRKGAERCHCYWKDDLSPIIDRIFPSDTLLIGSAVYLGDTTSQFHAVLERLHFCTLSYDDYHNYFTGKVHVGIIWTMNANLEMYKQYYEKKLSEQVNMLRSLNGEVRVLPCCDTLQVKDYSRYNMSSFDESLKKAHHDQQFPAELALAYQMGAALCATSHSIT